MGASASKQVISKTARKLPKASVNASNASPSSFPTSEVASDLHSSLRSTTRLVNQTQFEPRSSPEPSSKSNTHSPQHANASSQRPSNIIQDGMDPQYLARVQQLGSVVAASSSLSNPDKDNSPNLFDEVLKQAGITDISGNRPMSSGSTYKTFDYNPDVSIKVN